MAALLPTALLVLGGALPTGPAPKALEFDHFPSRLHAFVWRNYELVPLSRMAEVVGGTEAQLAAIATAMGLPDQAEITEDQQRRSYITTIRKNWHLLPYEQLLTLLGWTEEELAYALKEDDFLWAKLGGLKPACEPLRYEPPTDPMRERERWMREVLSRRFPEGLRAPDEAPFAFVDELSRPPDETRPLPPGSRFSPRFCYSYFALYGDPLLEADLDPYPDGYLARLARMGVNGVWLQVVLYKLAPFPWDPSLSEGHETRIANLRRLVERARAHGIGIYLYLNEPRTMPLTFFDDHPELRGVQEGDVATLCTSAPEVREYLRSSVERIFREVPDLGGAFTITASENLTNCWSHYQGANCPRCAQRGAAEVIADVNAAIAEGIRASGSDAEFIVWDWGWPDDQAEAIIQRLPDGVILQSVSEWSLPIERGGVESAVGEYSISSVGPGPRASRHWALARARGLRTSAKVQVGCTWELSAMPYIPATELVAEHLCNLANGVGSEGAPVDALMLGWTLGGSPSPHRELARVVDSMRNPTPEEALRRVAVSRFGPTNAPAVLDAWHTMSVAFREFPYHGGVVYTAPMQYGPSNLLWAQPTGYRATMVGFPYDDLDTWRAIYPREVFARQLELVSAGFEEGVRKLREQAARATDDAAEALASEADVAEGAWLHFRSSAAQARFVMARDAGDAEAVRELLDQEADTARRLYAIRMRDSRIGFEASNHYYYMPLDLVEKVLNCEYLTDEWLPSLSPQ